MNKKIKTLLLDDEQDALQTLEQILINTCPQVEIVALCTTVEEAYKKILQEKPELLFLDVNLGQSATSFELLDLFDETPFHIVFVTAHNEYAIKAIKYAAVDYLLKPIKSTDVITAVNRVQKRTFSFQQQKNLLKEHLSTETKSSKIALQTGNELITVEIQNIISCEADGNYTKVFLLNKEKIHVSSSLKELDYLLSEKGFYRVHKSFLINLTHIKNYRTTTKDTVTMVNEQHIPIATRKKQEFFQLLQNYYKP